MKRTWTMVGLSAVLCTLLAAVPIRAGQIDGPEANKSDSAKDLASIRKLLESIQQSLDKLEANSINVNLKIGTMMSDIARLKDRVEQLEKNQGPGRISLSPPNTGTVQLVNEFPQSMEFVVNQTVYRVLPGQTAKISLPLGSFTFRVLSVPGYEVPQNRVLIDDKPYIIRVHPAQ